MKGTTAGPQDRQRMLQVLQRMQESGSESSSDSEDAADAARAREAELLLQSLELQVSVMLEPVSGSPEEKAAERCSFQRSTDGLHAAFVCTCSLTAPT